MTWILKCVHKGTATTTYNLSNGQIICSNKTKRKQHINNKVVINKTINNNNNNIPTIKTPVDWEFNKLVEVLIIKA